MKMYAHNSHLITTTLLAVVASVLAVSPGHTASAATVNIPDTGLEAAIRDRLAKPTGPITDTDLETLTYLPASGRGITDLTGLEYCVNMRTLELYDNSISDLGPLAKLTSLQRLYVSNNSISGLGPLAGLTSLQRLSLSNNSISDLRPLARLTNLEDLKLWNNNISGLGPLAGLTSLEVLWLNDNKISNLRPLARLTSLQWLHLANNGVSGLRPLATLTSLQRLYLTYNSISDIQPLVDNAGLDAGDEVGLQRNPLSCRAITADIPILQDRGVTVSFDPLAFLDVSIRPRVLSLGSTNEWITCTIRTGEGCDVGDIDVASIRLEDTLGVQRSRFYPRWGTLIVKFNRSEVLAMLGLGEAELTLTGQFTSGLEFEGSDTIQVIDRPAWWWW